MPFTLNIPALLPLAGICKMHPKLSMLLVVAPVAFHSISVRVAIHASAMHPILFELAFVAALPLTIVVDAYAKALTPSEKPNVSITVLVKERALTFFETILEVTLILAPVGPFYSIAILDTFSP